MRGSRFFFSRKKGGLRDIKVCQEWGGGDGGGAIYIVGYFTMEV